MIYVDVSAAVHSRAGLGRYSERMAQALVGARPGEVALFYNQGADGRLPASLKEIPQRRVGLGYKPWRMMVLAGHLARVGFNRLVPDATLFHGTEHLLLPLRDVPTVLTVHDLIFKLFPDYHKRLNYWYLNWAMPIFCRRADAIIAVSHSTRRDLVEQYGVETAKITVVHEAAAEHFRPPAAAEIERVRREHKLPQQFLIHLGTIEPRKNLERLLEALKILRRDFPDLKLVLAGSKGWLYDSFFQRIEAEQLHDAVAPLGWVPDEDLPAVLAAASLAVQPSLYEGFGLPLLEHMASGQVVAASNAASHPEIGGDAAAYFDPTSAQEMASVIARLLRDQSEYEERRRLGLQQAAQFSWQRAARETLAVYDAIR